MSSTVKTGQLQIRVSTAEKNAIQHAASKARLDMSAFVLGRLCPAASAQFREALVAVANGSRFALAELNSLLSAFSASELKLSVLADASCAAAVLRLTPFLANYVAAMVELACARRGIPQPAWTDDIAPLARPSFGSELLSLRLYLLANSPAPFLRRNIFIDSTVGDRV